MRARVIATIIAKELVEFRRDRRLVFVGVLIALLAIGALISAAAGSVEQRRQVRAAQRDERSTFASQGEKSPHSAAHFGRMAYKPVPALALFDPGVAPYVGQVVWLEAHRQAPAMFRPAEDAPQLRRLADLSPSGILVTLLPLLIFLAGYAAFAGERERGTLRQLIGSGTASTGLFIGKITALAALGTTACFVVIASAAALAVTFPGPASTFDTLIRSVGLVLGYGAYAVTFAAIALLVSSGTRRSRSALLILLSLWAVAIVLTPRIAATVAESLHPAPHSSAFWTDMQKALRSGQPARDSAESRAIERAVLSRALGREVGESEIASLKVNRAGLRLEVSEVLDAAAYAEAYRDLYATYEAQKTLRRALSIFSPAIALQHYSSALAGTDLAAHHHFVIEAGRQRNHIVRAINEDLMLNGAGQRDYVAGRDFWSRVPEFAYRAPRSSFAFQSALPDLMVLCLWTAVASALAAFVGRRQNPL